MAWQSHRFSLAVSQVSESTYQISHAQVYTKPGCITLWWLCYVQHLRNDPDEKWASDVHVHVANKTKRTEKSESPGSSGISSLRIRHVSSYWWVPLPFSLTMLWQYGHTSHAAAEEHTALTSITLETRYGRVLFTLIFSLFSLILSFMAWSSWVTLSTSLFMIWNRYTDERDRNSIRRLRQDETHALFQK